MKFSQTILRLPDVLQETGYSRSTVYQRIDQGLFPRQIPLGPRCVGWPLTEIVALYAARIAGKSDDDIRALVEALHHQHAAQQGGMMNSLTQFRAAMIARDIALPSELLADGNLYRCNAKGQTDKRLWPICCIWMTCPRTGLKPTGTGWVGKTGTPRPDTPCPLLNGFSTSVKLDAIQQQCHADVTKRQHIRRGDSHLFSKYFNLFGSDSPPLAAQAFQLLLLIPRSLLRGSLFIIAGALILSKRLIDLIDAIRWW